MYKMFKVNYSGLRKRETYDELIDYLANKQEIIRYPDRWAKRVREHPYLTQLDGEGMFELEEQQENAWKEEVKEHRVQELAKKPEQTAQLIRASGSSSATSSHQFPGQMPDSQMNDDMEETRMAAHKRERETQERIDVKRANLRRIVAQHLGEEPGEIPYISKTARSRSPRLKTKKEEDVKTLMDDRASEKRTVVDESDVKPRKGKKSKVRPASADDVKVAGISMNRSTDMKFWGDQSANELRTQIGMRPGQVRRDYAFKGKNQLVDHVRQMIAAGSW